MPAIGMDQAWQLQWARPVPTEATVESSKVFEIKYDIANLATKRTRTAQRNNLPVRRQFELPEVAPVFTTKTP